MLALKQSLHRATTISDAYTRSVHVITRTNTTRNARATTVGRRFGRTMICIEMCLEQLVGLPRLHVASPSHVPHLLRRRESTSRTTSPLSWIPQVSVEVDSISETFPEKLLCSNHVFFCVCAISHRETLLRNWARVILPFGQETHMYLSQ